MKIFVDPQGNFQEATKYHIDLAKVEPVFKIFSVVDNEFYQAISKKNAGKNVRFENGIFVEDEKTIAEAKEIKLQEIYQKFVSARDATTYVMQADGKTLGYDRKPEDIVNFMAAKARAELGVIVPYKVYKEDGTKPMVPHTLEMFNLCLNQSGDEQLAAYNKFSDKRTEIENCQTISQVEAVIWD